MAERQYYQNMNSLEPEPVKLFARVSIGATGAPTLTAFPRNKGVRSISRTSTGLYVLTYGSATPARTDNYQRLIAFSPSTVLSSGIPAAPIIHVVTDGATSGTLTFQCENAAGGSATDPDNGAVLLLEITLSNSTAT